MYSHNYGSPKNNFKICCLSGKGHIVSHQIFRPFALKTCISLNSGNVLKQQKKIKQCKHEVNCWDCMSTQGKFFLRRTKKPHQKVSEPHFPYQNFTILKLNVWKTHSSVYWRWPVCGDTGTVLRIMGLSQIVIRAHPIHTSPGMVWNGDEGNGTLLLSQLSEEVKTCISLFGSHVNIFWT